MRNIKDDRTSIVVPPCFAGASRRRPWDVLTYVCAMTGAPVAACALAGSRCAAPGPCSARLPCPLSPGGALLDGSSGRTLPFTAFEVSSFHCLSVYRPAAAASTPFFAADGVFSLCSFSEGRRPRGGGSAAESTNFSGRPPDPIDNRPVAGYDRPKFTSPKCAEGIMCGRDAPESRRLVQAGAEHLSQSHSRAGRLNLQ